MNTTVEIEERARLEHLKLRLGQMIRTIDEKIQARSESLKEQKLYIRENNSEIGSMHQYVSHTASLGETAVAKKKTLQKLLSSPYFGRIDFREDNQTKTEEIYIGSRAFFDESENRNLIYDWRAPVASMFYDCELGSANYEAPERSIFGNISLKRQYSIQNGSLQYMLENSLNIQDTILQKELSKSSNDKMKTIASTIQRDQNAIIRNVESHVLVIQGVAGSGKTSVALHRIAFLLYRYRESIQSKSILIISPNKIFADYISNVLPELGEELIPETGMEELASQILGRAIQFETFFEQVETLLNTKNEGYRRRLEFKKSITFLNLINEYIVFIESAYFQPTDLKVGRQSIPAAFLTDRYKAYHRLPVFQRLERLAGEVIAHLDLKFGVTPTAKQKNEIRRDIKKMFRTVSLQRLYEGFYSWQGRSDFFKSPSGGVIEFADVFPLIYLKIKLEGFKPYDYVKHLLVDEMQDYTPMQYAVLSILFPCKKTLLGDTSQSVNQFTTSGVDDILSVFRDAKCLQLNKSYRSTFEICVFGKSIINNIDLIPIERHGQKPKITVFKSVEEEMDGTVRLVKKLVKSPFVSLGIICKTKEQAAGLYAAIENKIPNSFLLTNNSTKFNEGIVVTTPYLAKGLEFDQVVIPFADTGNYKDGMDRSMLYIACTRAMHTLNILSSGSLTSFIDPSYCDNQDNS